MEDKYYSTKYKNKNSLTELFLSNCTICDKSLNYEFYHELDCGHKIHIKCKKYLLQEKIVPETMCLKCQKDICILM